MVESLRYSTSQVNIASAVTIAFNRTSNVSSLKHNSQVLVLVLQGEKSVLVFSHNFSASRINEASKEREQYNKSLSYPKLQLRLGSVS